jgi:hypothetical protein
VDGYQNTAVGIGSLRMNTTGYRNSALGMLALNRNVNGFGNVAAGYQALFYSKAGHYATAIGTNAMQYANSTDTAYVNACVAVGFEALRGSENHVGNTGNYNTSLGYQSMRSNTAGGYNTAVGMEVMYSNTTGFANSAVGYHALSFNTTGIANTAMGSDALLNNTTGMSNTAIGAGAMMSNTTGELNTAFGERALLANTTGDYNTAIGEYAFFGNEALNNTVCIGYFAGGLVDANNRIEVGNTSVTFIGGQVGFSTYSDARIKDDIRVDVPGLNFITRLRPVTYNLNIHRQNEMALADKGEMPEWEGKYDIEKIRMTGFLAQDVEGAAREAGYDFSGVQKPENGQDLYSLRYSEFVMPLVKAVQEQQEMISSLQAENAVLKQQLEEIMKRLGME